MNIPSNLLENKNVLVGVTGSIAVYKALELVRLLVKAGANVRVVMSGASKKFINPLAFETLSRNKVLDDTNESWADDFNHIKITQWCDVMVIAPATANTMAKLSNAIADNILLQCALAYPKVKLIAPAANTNMLHNPIIQGSLKMLALSNYEIITTQTKELACEVVGDGAMAEPLEIFYHTARVLLQNDFWKHRRVIVTGGGTIERIDDVRFISNFSSGKMANAIATALFLRGADVNLISSKFDNKLPQNIHTIDIESTAELEEYLVDSIRVAKKGKLTKPSLVNSEEIKLIQKEPFLFMAAAVSDYTPEFAQSGKIKKDSIGENWQLQLVKNRDIISNINKDGIKTVAFKAELDEKNAREVAQKALKSKGVDAICLNVIDKNNPFGSDSNEIEVITKNGSEILERCDKLTIAFKLLDSVSGLCE